MITEDYCSFEISKLLNEKGFNEEIRSCYYLNDTSKIYLNGGICCNYNGYGFRNICVSAPTLQMTMKWLREVHNIAIETEWEHLWYAYVKPMTSNPTEDDYYQRSSAKYEEAIEEAIKYCLTNLI